MLDALFRPPQIFGVNQEVPAPPPTLAGSTRVKGIGSRDIIHIFGQKWILVGGTTTGFLTIKMSL
jgi:hypothetical protein